MENRQAYDTDLTDAEWNRLQPLVPAPKPGGRPPNTRGVRSSMGSVTRFGVVAHGSYCHTICPLGVAVYHYFWSWRRQGIWAQIHDSVREWVRRAAGREDQPRGAVLDSQSVRTSEQGGARGYD